MQRELELKSVVEVGVKFIVSFVIILFSFYEVFGASSYRVNASTNSEITEFGKCRIVRNGSAKDIFVPTNTSAEWVAFIVSSNPAGVVRDGCCTKWAISSTCSTAGCKWYSALTPNCRNNCSDFPSSAECGAISHCQWDGACAMCVSKCNVFTNSGDCGAAGCNWNGGLGECESFGSPC